MSNGGTTGTGVPLDDYAPWLEDFERRLAQHDAGVEVLARDVAARTPWTVHTAVGDDFPDPPTTLHGAPDVLCIREPGEPALWLEVELPETLVRRETVARLRALAGHRRVDVRVVLVTHGRRHGRDIPEARRLLMRAGIGLEVIALSPDEGLISGADW